MSRWSWDEDGVERMALDGGKRIGWVGVGGIGEEMDARVYVKDLFLVTYSPLVVVFAFTCRGRGQVLLFKNCVLSNLLSFERMTPRMAFVVVVFISVFSTVSLIVLFLSFQIRSSAFHFTMKGSQLLRNLWQNYSLSCLSLLQVFSCFCCVFLILTFREIHSIVYEQLLFYFISFSCHNLVYHVFRWGQFGET